MKKDEKIDHVKALIEIGRESYKPEAHPTAAQCLGTAVYRRFRSIDAIELAATICEENNFHEVAKRLRNFFNNAETVIYVSGGTVQEVYSNDPQTKLTIIDADNLESDGKNKEQIWKQVQDKTKNLTTIL
jgi:hypothetical protein